MYIDVPLGTIVRDEDTDDVFNRAVNPNTDYFMQTDLNKPIIVLEVGGIKRGTTWKVGLNGINRDGDNLPDSNDSTRASLQGLKLNTWRTNGTYILICGQHDQSLQWQGMPSMSNWLIRTIDDIRIYSERPILFRPHPRCPLPNIEKEFKNVGSNRKNGE